MELKWLTTLVIIGACLASRGELKNFKSWLEQWLQEHLHGDSGSDFYSFPFEELTIGRGVEIKHF